mmetsp:Transcript_64730/g.179854  ORF Transcript_64730/g.179854 Transcript_64730/m.179854 type:complete len:178 (+) Transcript_64730:490-1023(+)
MPAEVDTDLNDLGVRVRNLLTSDEFSTSFPDVSCTFDVDAVGGTDRTVELGYGIKKLIVAIRVTAGVGSDEIDGRGGGVGAARGGGGGASTDPDALSDDMALYVEERLGDELVQSVATDEVLGTTEAPPGPNDIGDYHILGLLEPHKRYQNAVALLQRRGRDQEGKTYSEPVFTWCA